MSDDRQIGDRDIGIVIPVHRGWASVRGLLSALSPLTCRCDVVIVDDASHDGGARSLQRDHPEVRLIARDVNGGFAAAANTGLRAVEGEVLALLNSDLEISPDVLAMLADRARVDHQAIFGPRTLDPEGNDLPVARRERTIGRMVADYFVPLLRSHRLRVRLRDVDVDAQAAGRPVHVGWLAGSCLVFHREVLERTGLFDERFFMDSEEVDWQLRARRAGIHAIYVPDAIATHDVSHGETRPGDASDRRFSWGWKGRFRYAAKHWGRTGILRLRASLVLAFLAMVPYWLVRLLTSRSPDEIRREIARHWRVLWIVP